MKVRLNIQHKKANVKSVLLHSDATIGRSTECNLRLASGQISRKHCRLLVNDERVAVLDLGSSNGTFLNEKQLTPNVETLVTPGAELKIGTVTFTLDFEDPTAETKIGTGQSLPVESEQPPEDTDEQITPLGGNPIFQNVAPETAPISEETLDETLDELSDAELEALLQEEGYEEESDYPTIEFEEEIDKSASNDPSEEQETVTFALDESSSPAETFTESNDALSTPPAPLEEDASLAPDDDDEEDVMRFLQDLDD